MNLPKLTALLESYTGSSDSEYLELAKDPEANEKRLQELVESAAKSKGYGVGPMYHGTNYTFTEFSPRSWFAFNKVNALVTGSSSPTHIIEVFLDVEPYDVTMDEFYDFQITTSSGKDNADRMSNKLLDQAEDEGYDSVEFSEYAILVSNPNQIKSADPVTYDKSGNIIPLSKRFDSSTDNINY